MAKINFDDKVSVRISGLPDINTVRAADLNEIKASVNWLYDNPSASGTLQETMESGSIAIGITTGMTVLTEDSSITFESADVTGGNSISTLDLYAQNTGAVYASLRIEDDGANVTELNFTSPSDGVGTFTFTDEITSKGMVYGGDYSPQFTHESLTTKRYDDNHIGGQNVNALIPTPTATEDGYSITRDDGAGQYTLSAGGGGGGNTLYTADDTITGGDRKVTQSGNYVWFEGGDFHVGNATGNGVFNVDGGTTSTGILHYKRDKDAGVGLNGFDFLVNPRGAEERTIRTNGTAFRINNEWTIGDNRKSFDFIASVNNNYFSIFQSTNGTTENVRIGEIGSWWNPRNTTAFGFAFGHTSPLAGTVHLDNLDLKVEGDADANLLVTDFSTNQFSIGSTPYANVKASITNAEGVATTFVVLNQATNKNFQVMETGVVSTNGQLSIGMGTAPASTSDLIMNGDFEQQTTNWHYFGDPSTDGTYRMGADGLGNLVIEERIAGVWTNLQTW